MSNLPMDEENLIECDCCGRMTCKEGPVTIDRTTIPVGHLYNPTNMWVCDDCEIYLMMDHPRYKYVT